MTSAELITTYSFVGDTIAVITSASILLLVHFALYFSNDRNFILFKRAIFLIGSGAIFNVLFALCCIYRPDSHLLICLLRGLYHSCILAVLFIFLIYTRNLVDLPKKSSKRLSLITTTIFTTGLLFDLLSPITHFGFYYGNDGWHDSTYIKPYTLVYIYAMVAMAYMIVIYGYRMIKSLHHILFATEAICIFIVLIQNTQDSNTFTAFTFLLPVIVVLVTLHSMPYDQVTGAMNADAYERFINHAKKKNRKLDYMILELDIDQFHELPEALGKALHTFWTKTFHGAALFNLHGNVYVLAIEHNRFNSNNRELIDSLIKKEFAEYYQLYHIDYKGLILIDANYIDSLSSMTSALSFFLKQCPTNDFLYPDEKQLVAFERSKLILAGLSDIDLNCDLNDERVLVYCQPVKNVATGGFDTAEILMRMKFPDLGLVFPDQFIPVAEDNGYIHTLSKIIINKTCVELKKLLNEGYNIDRVSINLTISDLYHEDFCNEILSIIKNNGIPYDKIAIELTESQTEEDFIVVYNAVEYLREFGIKFYLDDFGTGYSNLERILRLNLDIIKFDRSLLVYADSDKNGQYTLHHFSEIFEGLDYKILFEGIETDENEQLCINSYADYLQGYKYSKPIPMEDARQFFAKSN